MLTTQAAGAGPRLVEYLFENLLRGDEQWAVRNRSGFDWWTGSHRQRISLYGPLQVRQNTIWRLVVTTRVAETVPPTHEANAVIDAINQLSSLSALARCRDGSLSLAACVVLHDDAFGWTSRVAQMAAGLQLSEAITASANLTMAGCTSPADTLHPRLGARPEQDELVHGVRAIVRSEADAEPGYLGESVFEDLGDYFRRWGWETNASDSQLTTEPPFGDWTALLEMSAVDRHPTYGAGVLILLRLPTTDSPDPGLTEQLSEVLNRETLEPGIVDHSYSLLGGWLKDPGFDSVTSACLFVPRVLAQPTVLLNAGMSVGLRAQFVAKRYAS
jgi:hypothetical protein